MNPELNHCITGLASAQISLFGILFKHLGVHLGDEIKRDFADELSRIMAISAQSGEPIQPCQRVIFEQIVDWLKAPERGWTPVVIEGARAGQGMTGEAAPSPALQA
jgi:hypothetical protein